VTDSSDPNARPPRRPDPSREPPTIDLKAKVVDDGARDPAAASATTGASQEPGAEIPRDESGLEPVGLEAVSEAMAARSDEVTPDAPISDRDMTPPETETLAQHESAEQEFAQSARKEPARASTSYGPLAAAGLLGGLVGAGLVLAYDIWGSDSAQDDPRIAQIEQRLAGVPRADALQRLEARLGTLEGAQGAINQRIQAAQALADKANARAEEAANRPAPAPQTPGPAPQTVAAITDLGNRIGALENQMRERTQAASAAAQASTTAVQGLEKRLADQDQKLATLTRQVAEGGSDATRAGTRVVLADRLNNALRDGAPYADVLGALTRLNVDPARLQPLEPFASQGAPTAASLAQSFKPLSEQMLRESRSGTESWTDRLARMAERVVTVRALDEPAGAGVQGLVARIDTALTRGDFANAAAAWDALPEPARRLSEDWGRQLKQRAAAATASRAIAADAVAALNPPTR
jgi:hypothetical protein